MILFLAQNLKVRLFSVCFSQLLNLRYWELESHRE